MCFECTITKDIIKRTMQFPNNLVKKLVLSTNLTIINHLTLAVCSSHLILCQSCQ